MGSLLYGTGFHCFLVRRRETHFRLNMTELIQFFMLMPENTPKNTPRWRLLEGFKWGDPPESMPSKYFHHLVFNWLSSLLPLMRNSSVVISIHEIMRGQKAKLSNPRLQGDGFHPSPIEILIQKTFVRLPFKLISAFSHLLDTTSMISSALIGTALWGVAKLRMIPFWCYHAISSMFGYSQYTAGSGPIDVLARYLQSHPLST